MRRVIISMILILHALGDVAIAQVVGPLRQPPPQNLPQSQLAQNLERARKLALIRAWGLNITAAALQPSFRLTPRQPSTDHAVLTTFGDHVSTDLRTGADGVISHPASADPQSDRVIMTVDNSTPATWWFIECKTRESGDQQYFMRIFTQFKSSVSDYFDVIDRSTRSASGDTVNGLFEPSTRASRAFSVEAGHLGDGWSFEGCELTPIVL